MTFSKKIIIENCLDFDNSIADIYTNGVCSNESGGVGGWGALIIENGEERQIYGGVSFTTNNQMELLACIYALESLSEPSMVILNTDSKYVIEGITKWIKGWQKNGWLTKSGDTVKNKTFWLKLEHLTTRHQITWNFVRGHSGNRGNEIADQLAVRGKEEEKLKIKKSLVK